MEIKKVNLSPNKAKKLCQDLDFHPIQNYDGLILREEGLHTTRLGSTMTLMDANLHLDLNKLVEKQSFMQEGKYKRARVYLFETENVYIAAVCETGDRGSSFSSTPKIPRGKENQEKCLQEMQDFFRALFLNILKNNEKAFQDATSLSEYAVIIEQILKKKKLLPTLMI